MNLDPDIVATLAAALPDLIAVYRFGSHGSPSERSDSDIDVAILGRQPYEDARVWHLGQELAAKLGRDVDLVDLRTASTVFRAQIITAGNRLFCADRAYCDSHEDYIFSAYARLNEERRDILSDVLRRGSVHGG